MEEQAVTLENFAEMMSDSADEQPEPEVVEPTETDSEAEEAIEEQEEPEAPEPEEEEGEEEAEQSDEDSAEITVLTAKDAEGNEIEVPAEEAIKAWKDRESMRADYTRKTQQLAQERETQAQQIKEQATQQFKFVESFAQDVGQLQYAQTRLQQLNGINWNDAFDTDPVAAAKLQAEQNQLNGFVQNASRNIEQKRAYMQQRQQQDEAQAFAKVWEHMGSVDTEFTRERLVGIVEKAQADYGIDGQVITSIKDPALMQFVNELVKKADKYDALQKSKPAINKKVAAAPSKVTKQAGTKKPSTKLDQQMKRLAQTGSRDDFARALSMTRS